MTCRVFFRGDKGTPNANAYKTLMTGVVAALGILIAADPAWQMWERYIKKRPWVTNDLTLVEGPGAPLVRDVVVTSGFVSGSRSVWAEGADGLRLCGAIRSDSWGGDAGPERFERLWTFYAFTGGQCEGIARPFRLCSTFTLRSDHGVDVRDGPYCSGFSREE